MDMVYWLILFPSTSQEHLETDYGAAFVQVVEELFCDYLWQLESTLPKPCFQKVRGKHSPMSKGMSSGHVAPLVAGMEPLTQR